MIKLLTVSPSLLRSVLGPVVFAFVASSFLPAADGPQKLSGCKAPRPRQGLAPLNPNADFTVSATPNYTWNVNGGINAPLTLTRGVTYTFDLTSVTDEHPFLINDQPGNPWGTVFLPAAYGSTVTFTPGASMPATIYYHCEVHYGGMAGPINLVLCPGDVTGDAAINVSDFLALKSAFGNACSGCWADIDGNGTVAVGDFLALNSAFGNSCN